MGIEILDMKPSEMMHEINKRLSKRWKVIKCDVERVQDEEVEGTLYKTQLQYEDGDILNFSIYLGLYENFKVVEVCIEGKTDYAKFLKENEWEEVKRTLEARYGDLLEAIKRDCKYVIF
jgi:hypothetical protein